VSNWIILWAKSLAAGGVPKTAIFTHIAAPTGAPPLFISADKVLRFAYKDSSANVTAFNPYSYPGFSVHGTGSFTALYRILAAHASTPWAISEGSNVNLGNSFSGGPSASGFTMEQYLGRAFNHGAVFVNLFGWNRVATDDPFAKAATGTEAIAAYKKFLSGEKLEEGSITKGVFSSAPAPVSANNLFSKVQEIQHSLPTWLSHHPDRQSTIQSLVPKLYGYMKAGNASEAEKTADEILSIIVQ
jgi:hypothetical protein